MRQGRLIVIDITIPMNQIRKSVITKLHLHCIYSSSDYSTNTNTNVIAPRHESDTRIGKDGQWRTAQAARPTEHTQA